jgi:hypothetical protein
MLALDYDQYGVFLFGSWDVVCILNALVTQGGDWSNAVRNMPRWRC